MKHQNDPHHLRRYTRLKAALEEAWTSPAMRLHSRLEKCGGPDWGYRFTCRTPACPGCRDRYIAAQRRYALKRFAGSSGDRLAMLTINLGAVLDVAEIATMVRKARRDMRNCLDRERRSSSFWWATEVLAWIEVDAFDAADFNLLASDRQLQIEQFRCAFANSGRVWLPSLHGLVRLGEGVDVKAAEAAFASQWPGHRRVDLRPLLADRSVKDNVASIINYSLKNECTTTLMDPITGKGNKLDWPSTWMADYYSWLCSTSRGFQSTRIHVKANKPKGPLYYNMFGHLNERIAVESDHYDVQPMPFIYSISDFHRV